MPGLLLTSAPVEAACLRGEANFGVYNPTAGAIRVLLRGRPHVKLNGQRTDPAHIILRPYQTALLSANPICVSSNPGCRAVPPQPPLRSAFLSSEEPDSTANSFDRIWTTHLRVAQAFEQRTNYPRPGLMISVDPEANARVKDDRTIEVTVSLAEKLQAAGEVAFAVAHEFGHIVQRRSKSFRYHENQELDADAWAIRLMLDASYDPAAARTALKTLRAGLEQASQLPPLLSSLFDRRSSSIDSETREAVRERQTGASNAPISATVRRWALGAAEGVLIPFRHLRTRWTHGKTNCDTCCG